MQRTSAWALLLLAQIATAQQTVWGQCGGIGYSGPTSCVAGSSCSTQNSYYAQCLPGSGNGGGGAATTTTTAGQTTKTTMATTTTTSTKTSAGSGGSTTTAPPASNSGNPFKGYQPYVNPYYASEVQSLAIPSLAASLAPKASAVAKVPSFVWLDTAAKVPTMGTYLADIKAKNAGCTPSPTGGVANYKNYIDSIRAHLLKYPDVHTILVIEPDSLANLVTNMNVAKCSGAHDAYLECTDYALKQLNLPNVAMYLDAGHAGWLGWPANIGPAADLFASVYKNAGSPAAVRGLATNVANYNAWSISTCPSYTQGDQNCDEKRYINALAPLLRANGFDAHFIMDTSRNGVQPTKQQAWGDWCNVIGTGFGTPFTTDTGDALQDAFIWVKPGGECDGTSDTSSPRYDAHCGYSDALKPAPEAGTWFQAYFEQLLVNANPSF
uniref:Glucanase n=1 Tax=Penicillium oxalicum TaxID=69781 RepID=A0A088STL5_PENOX|nr:cellobiohydrolase 3 [Penicillium oxalicum]